MMLNIVYISNSLSNLKFILNDIKYKSFLFNKIRKMIGIETKISIFKNYLLLRNGSYGDVMKDEIYSYFFEIAEEDISSKFHFLAHLNSSKQIENKVDFLVSKMIMHEHEDGVRNIIENYVEVE